MGLIGDILTGVGEGLQQVDVIGGRNRIDRQAQLKIENERAGREEERQKAKTINDSLISGLSIKNPGQRKLYFKATAKETGIEEDIINRLSMPTFSDDERDFVVQRLKDANINDPEGLADKISRIINSSELSDSDAAKFVDDFVNDTISRASREKLDTIGGRLSPKAQQTQAPEPQAQAPQAPVVEEPDITTDGLSDNTIRKVKELLIGEIPGSSTVLARKLAKLDESIAIDREAIARFQDPNQTKGARFEDIQQRIEAKEKRIESKQKQLDGLTKRLKNRQIANAAGRKVPGLKDILALPEWQAGYARLQQEILNIKELNIKGLEADEVYVDSDGVAHNTIPKRQDVIDEFLAEPRFAPAAQFVKRLLSLTDDLSIDALLSVSDSIFGGTK